MAAKKILRYLSNNKTCKLTFHPYQAKQRDECSSDGQHVHSVIQSKPKSAFPSLSPLVECYADADWGGSMDDRRSTTGYIIRLWGCTISWASVKQRTVALSTAEAEYQAISVALQEVLWWMDMLSELGMMEWRRGRYLNEGTIMHHHRDEEKHAPEVSVPSTFFSSSAPSIIFTDNQSARALCLNDVYHSRAKHIDIRHHFIRECVKGGDVAIKWVESKHQWADLLTKPLDKNTFITLREKVME